MKLIVIENINPKTTKENRKVEGEGMKNESKGRCSSRDSFHSSNNSQRLHFQNEDRNLQRPPTSIQNIGNTIQQDFWSQKFDIHQTTNEKHVHESDPYFQKHVFFSKCRIIGCHVISLSTELSETQQSKIS